MKQLNLFMSLLFLLAMQSVKAAETEPNNSKADANTLALNGNNTGAINVSGDEDWYKITTNGDGRLDVTIGVSNGITLRCYIFDTDGTTELASGYSSSTTTVSKDGLATGTYYVKLIAFYSGQLPVYTVSNTLTKPVQVNDVEPNNNRATAVALPLNGNKAGHVGYYYNVQRDTADWYKVTTNANGRLRLTLNSANGNTVRFYLYDNDGTTQLNSAYSASSAVINQDGLAPGTYYVRVTCFYNTDFAPYTLYDSLFLPAQANDIEPNDNRATAKVLPLNGSNTGHVGYYYNLNRDTADWYKVTTNANGRLRLTLNSANGITLRFYLYDNNGTTLLNSAYSSSSAIISQDGLTAGIYYVRVTCFYNTDFAPYTLYDSLFLPAQANDTEPNGDRATAKVLPLNDNKTGHVGYYYNLNRDTTDWYKVTTNEDGLLRLTLNSANGNTVRFYLYDNDGTTLLSSAYSSSSAVINQDGLAAGTYYVRVTCFYSSDFAPYTLYDSLFTYNYVKDAEPNGKPYLAKTISANSATDGHAGFYYNSTRDTVDWYKINYTGSGNLDFTINQETLLSGGTNTLYFQVYKDTAVSPVHSSYSSSASRAVNLTALTQGYYWIKIYPFYNSQFSSYSFSNSFTQVNIAKVKAVSYDTLAECNTGNKITFKLSQSHAPYTVQLYRYGVAYGSPLVTEKTAAFKNLPAGSYYATAYGDGATGNAFGKSKNVSVEPVPAGLNTTNIAADKAKLNWTSVSCAAYYTVQYKVHGTVDWTTKKTTGNENSYLLKGLTPNTTYDWRVATSDSANGITATGAYADSILFTTPSSLVAVNNNQEDNLSVNGNNKNPIASLYASPNPASSFFVIHFNNDKAQKLNAILYDATGKAVWSSGLINTDALNNRQVNVSQVSKGIFYLKIMNESGIVIGTTKVVVSR